MPAATAPDLDALRASLLAEAARRAPADLRALATPSAEGPPPPALAAWLHARRDALAGWIEDSVPPRRAGGGFAADPAADLAGEVTRFLLHRNQFLPLDGARLAGLEALHARALAAAADALRAAPDPDALATALAEVATAFRRDLAELVAALRPETAGAAGLPLREVVSAEYGPELQLRVLGLDAGALGEPILDLGCGAEARLVRLLRAAGRDACGVDRLARPGPGVGRADWFEVPLPAGSLGTVLSHLGFSLHFLHHHLRPGDEALRYARRYMEVLRSLRPGGVFAYAPGLPFVEEHLDAGRWRLERTPLPVPDAAVAPPVPWYSSRVRRLG